MLWNWQGECEPGIPEQNMAVDAALLDSLVSGQSTAPTVRVYRWDRPAVSIGRLQPEEPVRRLYPCLPVVRRPTGGRAVVHGDDLTITVAVRLDCLPPESRSVLTSHQWLMDPIKFALETLGIPACYGGCAIGSQKAVINCFELSAACDLIDGNTGKKLAGSAQRREESALLQQISLPLSLISDPATFYSTLHQKFSQTFVIY